MAADKSKRTGRVLAADRTIRQQKPAEHSGILPKESEDCSNTGLNKGKILKNSQSLLKCTELNMTKRLDSQSCK
jgi:hypothetical protein